MNTPETQPIVPPVAVTRRKTRKAASLYLVIVFAVSIFLWGFYLGSGNGKTHVSMSSSASGTVEIVNTGANKATKQLDFNEFWDLWQVIEQRYVHQPVDEQKMFYGAMAGVVASLGDPHSVFFDPPDSTAFQQQLSGQFEGIGAELGFKKDKLVVVAPLPGSPAETAGLKAGDWIIGIDDTDASGLTLDDAVALIRGKKGTKVKLMVIRGTEKKPREIEIIRDTIQVQSVKTSFVKSPRGKSVAVITVTNFNSDTAVGFQQAVAAAVAKKPAGLVLDLRGNPGGYLDAAVSMLGEWIPGQIAVSERYADGTKDDHQADGPGLLSAMPTVVLVDGGSASASEITSGALKDLNKAVLIGTQTFGKGSVQDLIPLRDGATVKLTIAEWLTPKGTHIDKNGIAPDYTVERTEDDFINGRDPQLDAARAFFDGVMPHVTTSASATAQTK